MIQIHPKVEQMGGVKWDVGMTQQAERAAKVHQEKMNKGRRLPRQLREVEAISEAQAVHVFNVGPFQERIYLGTWGDVTASPCPAGTPWVHVCTIPGIFVETIPGEDEFKGEQISGSYIAQCILGEGPDLRNSSGASRRSIGLFVGEVRGPRGAEPKPEEVAAANEAVAQHLHDLVLEANAAHAMGAAEAANTIGTKHRLAAQLTGRTDLDWYKAKSPEKKVPCPACGTPKNGNFPVCAQCGHKDEELYQKLFGAKKTSPEEEELQRLRAENKSLTKKS